MSAETLERTSNQFNNHERAYNDVTTWAAEVLDGSMRTEFEYSFDGQELYASDGGNLTEIFDNAIEDAYKLAREDPRLSFEPARRVEERKELDDMLAMAQGELPGNTMIIVSDRPHALEHVEEDIGGYNGKRRQAMLRVINKTPEGKIKITSQSLDRSDRESLESIYRYFGLEPEAGELLGQRICVEVDEFRQDLIVDELTREYDKTLEQKLGESCYSGRTPQEFDNTYDFVLHQQDLINFHIESNDSSDESLYMLAAALEARWNCRGDVQPAEISLNSSVEFEMLSAAQQAMREGKGFSGCGVTISASGEMGQLGYGNDMDIQARSDQYGSLTFRCQKGHINERPHGKLIDCCKTCGIDVTC